MAYKLRGLVVGLAHGLVFIPAPDDIPDGERGLEALDWAAAVAAATAPDERAVLVEVECWGACNHGAVGFERGAVAFGPLRTRDAGDDRAGYDVADPRETAVNRALRWLGVPVDPGCADELESAGLDRLGG